MHSLECLRLEADCRELAKNAPGPDTQAHYLRMAEVWLALATSGPASDPDEDAFETETQPA